MFENIGGKIQKLAQIICILGIIASFIAGITVGAIGSYRTWQFLLIMVLIWGAGALASWISCFMVYGFGRLIENSEIIKDNTREIIGYQKAIADNQKKQTGIIDKKEKTNPPTYEWGRSGVCEECGMNGRVKDCIIKDSTGTRYRKICPDCLRYLGATPLE